MKSHRGRVDFTEALAYVRNHFEPYEDGFQWEYYGHEHKHEDGMDILVMHIKTMCGYSSEWYPAEFEIWFEDCIDGLYGEW